MKLQFFFFLISYFGRNKSSSSFCGIIVLLPELPLHLDVLWLEHCCKTLELSILIISFVFFSLLKKKNLKSGLLTIDHLSIPIIQLMKRWHTISFCKIFIKKKKVLPLSQFVCFLFHFEMSQNIVLFLKLKTINILMSLLCPYFISKTIFDKFI